MMHWMTPSRLKEASHAPFSLVKTTQWLEDFVAKPNMDLGRAGVVCPFVNRALKLETIQMMEVSMLEMSQSELENLIRECREIFLKQFPQQGKLSMYKALLLIFPDIADDQCSLIDQVQKKLKPFFVEKKLMLGEFYPCNQSPGLHNPDFRPLQSPVPMLVIRSMTEADLPFLSRTSDAPEVRAKFLEAYLEQMVALGHRSRLNEAQRTLEMAYQAIENQKTVKKSISRCPFKRLGRAANQMRLSVNSLFEIV